jgi:putative ABC transport system permease protein
MNLAYISFKNVISRPLSAALSLLLLVLGTAMIAFMIVVNDGLQNDFRKNIKDIDLVVGAKGSPLQLILSAVYQIDNPTGNINYLEIKKKLKHPLVEKTIPLAYGDSYSGYRIVGTMHSYTEHYGASIEEGKLWSKPFECTIGAEVAANGNLKVGDTFFSQHGLQDDDAHVHDNQSFKVVGVLKETGTVLDRLILTPIESVWLVHESHDHDHDHNHDHDGHNHADEHNHDHHDHEHVHEAAEAEISPDREITAMLVTFKNSMGMMTLPGMINKDTAYQAALPAIEINRLFELFGAGIAALRIIALVIIVISALSMFVSLYNSLKERKYELALMRSLGASPFKLFLLILIEANLLAVAGIISGYLASRMGLYFADQFASAQLSGALFRWTPLYPEYLLFLLIIAVANVAALIPALQSTRVDIASVLTKK